MSHSIEPNIQPAIGRFPDAFHQMLNEQKARLRRKARAARDVKAAIHVGCYETKAKLNAGLDQLIERFDDEVRMAEARQELREAEFERQTGFLSDFEDYNWRSESGDVR